MTGQAGWTIQADSSFSADIRALLEAHLAFAAAHTPEGAGHALDLAGLQAPDTTLFVARSDDDDALLGCAALRALAADAGELKSMHVAASARRRGVGRALAGHVIEAARARGWRVVRLETGRSAGFAASRALYASLGFEPCPPYGVYRNDAFSYCMERRL
jgi:putative acetyltransferase